MSSHPKSVRVEILGEDTRGQAQQFIWRVLQKLGFNSRLFHKTSAPAGKGMGIKFVEEEFPKLLVDHRKLFIKSKSVRLIVCCDADKKTTADRRKGLIQAVEQAGLHNVASQEGVAILIAKYHIETWLEYLEGHEANEDDEYKHRKGKQGDVGQAVSRFAGYVTNPQSMPNDVLPSIRAAVEEICKELLPDFSNG